jgi:ABC-type antimicrobial peptide transport system permease subunit
MLKNYIKIAWRNLVKSKVTGFINIAGLAIGMAVALMIGLWVHDELTYNHYHKNYDKIAQIYLHQTFNSKTTTSRAISLPTAPALRNEYGADFEYVALGSWNFDHTIAYGEKRLLKEGMHVETDFPKIFSFDLLAGNLDEVLKNPNSILLSKSLADALFGKEDPIGKIIKFDTSSDLEVSGVFNDLPYNSELSDVHYYVPWEFYKAQNDWVRNSADSWGNHSFQLFAQLKEHADFEQVSAKIKDAELAHNPEAKPALFLFPMAKWHLYSNFKNGENIGGRIQFVWMFGIIGIFVLFLACINFMNLSTARSEKRAKEVGVRKAVGSLKSQLINQFLSESLLVTFLALIFSFFLVQLSLDWFNNLADKQLAIPFEQPVFWALALGFTILTGLLAGSYPAFYLSSFEPLQVLKGSFKLGSSGSIPRKVLVTIQFTVSIALIIGTIAVFQQIQHAKNRPTGYNKDSVIQFFSNNEIINKYSVLETELLSTGVVESVSAASSPITSVWSNRSGFDWEGKDPEVLMSFGYIRCSHDFGKTIGWNILQGRDFSRDFATDTVAMILNEAAVEQTGLEDVIGKSMKIDGQNYQIVGVVQNMVMESPWRPIKPTVFQLSHDWANVYNAKLKAGVPVQDALAKVESVYEKLSPSSPFEFQFIDEQYERKFRAEERIGKLARFFAFLAIFISCLGLFGLSAYVAEQRSKEIGIRKVLGASVANLWALQSKHFLILVVLACLIATPMAWYVLEGWLAGYDYRIQLSWSVFVIACILALIVTLLTVSYQSIKAAMINPAKSLKSE